MSNFRSITNKVLKRFGYNITKTKSLNKKGPEVGTMRSSLENIHKLGISPGCVVDIGASKGDWTKLAIRKWPNAQYELIEPLIEQENSLLNLKIRYPNVNFHLAVAGESPGKVSFSVSNDLDGSGVYGEGRGSIRQLPVVTVDEICADRSGPFVIKLDTHGYEVPILKGAINTLRETDLLIIEVYGFHVSPTGKLFHELSVFLHELGFRLFDIVDIMRRPKDQAFWQADAFFIKIDHPLFGDELYS